MTASIAKLSNALAAGVSASSFDEEMKIAIRSNVGRDALKRASDFKTIQDALFETIANAYEAYNIGETPRVSIDIKGKGKDAVITVRDYGVGMSLVKGLANFFSLHLKTERRENGLNMRGYNGTGKIAWAKYAMRMQVETVMDGLRNIAVLTVEMLEEAANTGEQPTAQILVKNQPTADPNGTTVTISRIRKGFTINAETMRAIRTKLAFEQMMWMKGAVIELNGEVVAPEMITSTEKWDIVSECQNFSGTIYYNADRPYQHELPAVYMSAGRVFLAREQFGMEGKRFRQNVHVDVKASEEWAQEHFYDRREAFVAESRDLKLKLQNNHEAQAFADFVTTKVEKVMNELDRREDERRRQSMSEYEAKLEREFSKMFSNLMLLHGGQKSNVGGDSSQESGSETIVRIHREQQKKGEGKQKTSLINFEFTELPDDKQFQIDYESKRIKLNKNFTTLKALAGYTDSPVYQVASTELAAAAFCDLLTHVDVTEACAERTPSVAEILSLHTEIGEKVRKIAADVTHTLYARIAAEVDKRA